MFIDEDDRIELKEILNNTLPKEIVSLLNTEGGTIYIGINNRKQVIGLKNIDDSMKQVSDIITEQISPRCVTFVFQTHETIEGKEVIRINVQKGNQLFSIENVNENAC